MSWGRRISIGLALMFAAVVRGAISGGTYAKLWLLVGLVKLVVLMGGVWWLIDSGLVLGLSLAVGYGALPLGITFGAFLVPRAEQLDAAGLEAPTASVAQRSLRPATIKESP